jgi:hypothetical protein
MKTLKITIIQDAIMGINQTKCCMLLESWYKRGVDIVTTSDLK